jgi:hypothetical protein
MKRWLKRTLIGIFGATLLFGGLAAFAHRNHHGHGWQPMSEEDAAKMKERMVVAAVSRGVKEIELTRICNRLPHPGITVAFRDLRSIEGQETSALALDGPANFILPRCCKTYRSSSHICVNRRRDGVYRPAPAIELRQFSGSSLVAQQTGDTLDDFAGLWIRRPHSSRTTCR